MSTTACDSSSFNYVITLYLCVCVCIDAPVCRPGLTRYFGVSRHENVQVACQVEANPVSEMSYKWFLNNSAETIEVPRHRYNNNQTTSLLSYKPAASLDYGTLLCYATNSAGVQQEPCVFHILTAGNVAYNYCGL